MVLVKGTRGDGIYFVDLGLAGAVADVNLHHEKHAPQQHKFDSADKLGTELAAMAGSVTRRVTRQIKNLPGLGASASGVARGGDPEKLASALDPDATHHAAIVDHVFERGDMFGEVAVITNRPQKTNVMALTWMRVLCLSLRAWDEASARHPSTLGETVKAYAEAEEALLIQKQHVSSRGVVKNMLMKMKLAANKTARRSSEST